MITVIKFTCRQNGMEKRKRKKEKNTKIKQTKKLDLIKKLVR